MFCFQSSCRDAALAVENHQRTGVTHVREDGCLSLPPGPVASFQKVWTLDGPLFSKLEEDKSSMKSSGTIGSLKSELSQFKTHDRVESVLMPLTKTKRAHRVGLQSSGVCALSCDGPQRCTPWPLHLASTLWHHWGETALFGFLRPNQTSQSITVLHTDPLSQQNPIRRITRAPNFFNFAEESRTQTGEKIAEIIRWKGSILNMEKYLGVQWRVQMDVMTSHDRRGMRSVSQSDPVAFRYGQPNPADGEQTET